MDVPTDKITYFAETDARNKRVPFGIKSKDRLKHVYVIGKTGMGKSTLLENMAIQDIQGGEGLAVVDPHGAMAEKLLEYVPEERIKDVIYFAPFDLEYPLAFNVMEAVSVDKRHLVANGLMSTFEKIWVDAWSARMAYILNNTLLALLEYPGATLLGVNRMLSDKDYRNKVVANITDPSVRSFWVDEFAKYGPQYMQEAGAAIQNKIGQFTANPLVRNIIGQPQTSFNLRKIMDDKKILIVNLSKGLVGEGNAKLIGGMLITKLYLAAMSRADLSAPELNKLPNFYLYVDEFQSFANKSFADILSEARKYKLNLTIAHQYIEQMEEEVRAAVFGNVGTMITFRVGAYDAEVLEKEFAPMFTAEDLVNLGSFQIYLKLMIDGISSQPFSAVTQPPIEKPEHIYVAKIMEASRSTYARPRELVERSIREWHEEGRTEAVPRPSNSKWEGKGDRRDRSEPRAMDFRGKRPEREEGKSFDRAPDRPFDRAQDKEDRNIKRQVVDELPKDDFKPLKALSLEKLKEKSDNQRKPKEESISALRDALSAIVKPEAAEKKADSRALPSLRGLRRDSNEPSSPAPKQTGPSTEELKKILNG